MTGLAIFLALFFAGQEAVPTHARITHAVLAGLERAFDGRLERANAPDSFYLLGSTRGVYLEGYGVVFSAEINLIVSPNLSPFHQSFTKIEITRIHDRKVRQLPVLRQNMREMLAASAASLENLPPSEQVVVAVSLFHYSWEDASGMPNQIVMQAERQKLLSNATRETAVRVQEF
ncbi:MAG TPA: hypothetical protein VKR61_13680 [Bryobacteraceae bacterium]|nr:hypothetical protein [Bryobacteraceae bacterium]